MKVLLILLLSLSCHPAFAQDYTEYQRIIGRADGDILANDLPSAARRLDTVLQNYPFIYARHCIKGLQVSCAQGDFTRAGGWLRQCFVQGVPLWIVRCNGIAAAVFSSPQTLPVIAQYDSLHAVYLSRIDTTLAKAVDKLYAVDQFRTGRVNDGFFLFRHTLFGLQWLRNNRREFVALKKIVEQRSFPGERLIGLPAYLQDSALGYQHVLRRGPTVVDERAYIMLLHYYSNPRRDINGLLLVSVRSGYLPAGYFGAINDFMATWGKGRYGDYGYYNVWHTDPDSSHYDAIESRRQSIGLPGLSMQAAINALYGVRSRSRTHNAGIILE